MKNRSPIAIAVDAVLAGLLVAVMATALVQDAPHEYLGVALFAAAAMRFACFVSWLSHA